MLRAIFRWFLKTIGLIVLLFVIAIVADYASHRVQPDSILVLKIDGPVVERGHVGVTSLWRAGRQTPMNAARRALDMAARDKRIVGLVVKVIDPSLEFAQAQELSAMIRKFARSGKWTEAYLETAGEGGPGNSQFLLASAADSVSMMPRGELNLVGMEMRELFVRGTLDWLGIRPDVDAIGEYKSLRNQLVEKGFTPAHREEDEALIDNLFEQLLRQVSTQRKLTMESVHAIVDRAPLTAEQALAAKLIDRLEYEDQFSDRVKERGGNKHPVVDAFSYSRPYLFGGHAPDRIAIIYGTGAIARGEGSFDPLFSPGGNYEMGSESMADAFKTAREDKGVHAVVFRIDSPGGSVVASELVRRQVELTARSKPVIVSMGSYGASGGYWVSAPASRIIAEPGTITGSIGVVEARFNVAAAASKLGVTSDFVSRGQNVTLFDEFADLTPEQQKKIHDEMLTDVYNKFLHTVATGRHLTLDQVERVARGRIWSGEQALNAKLVDSLGDLDAAIAEAKKEAKLPAYRTVETIELPEQTGLFEQLLGGGGTQARLPLSPVVARMLEPWLGAIRSELIRAGAAGALYCSRLPIM